VSAPAGALLSAPCGKQAAALDPGDDPALRAFHDEGVRSLQTFGLVRRVIAAATAP
jgi:hypothetical protein